MNNFNQIVKNLSFNANGFWVANEFSNISYPEGGNELCAEIEDSSFWFNHRNNVISTAVKKFSPTDTIFDIGGGNGFVAKGLIENGFDCVLVEPGMAGAKKAVERGVKQVICATTKSAGFQSNTIPNIGVFDVIEHIEDDSSFLKELHSLLVPGGRVYATVPAYTFLWSSEDVQAGHFRRYTIKSISEVFKKAGFQIEFATYFFRFLPIPIFIFRSLPSLLGLKLDSSDKSIKENHQTKENFSSKILNILLKKELTQIQKNKPLLFGGSCLIVAKS